MKVGDKHLRLVFTSYSIRKIKEIKKLKKIRTIVTLSFPFGEVQV